MRRFELAQRSPRRPARRRARTGCTRAPRAETPRASADSRASGSIDALQPQQPVLEIPRQRLDRHAGGHRLDHRRAEPEQRLVRIGFLRPLVDQLGEVARRSRAPRRRPPTAATASARRSPGCTSSRRSRSTYADAPAGQRLERAAEPPRGSAARSSPRRASCRDRASETRRCDPTHRACRSAESARRWYRAAFRGGHRYYS